MERACVRACRPGEFGGVLWRASKAVGETKRCGGVQHSRDPVSGCHLDQSDVRRRCRSGEVMGLHLPSFSKSWLLH
jgi:hypothetical protein